jgi:hypothetical protein
MIEPGAPQVIPSLYLPKQAFLHPSPSPQHEPWQSLATRKRGGVLSHYEKKRKPGRTLGVAWGASNFREKAALHPDTSASEFYAGWNDKAAGHQGTCKQKLNFPNYPQPGGMRAQTPNTCFLITTRASLSSAIPFHIAKN